MKLRLDQAVVDLGLAPSKTKAQELIAAGAIEIFDGKTWRRAEKSGAAFDRAKLQIRVIDNSTLKYVSRGGLKLEGALAHWQIDVTGIIAMDVGVSTGGFSDCLLQRGAKRVIAIDISKGEMHEKLRSEKRVEFFGEINARDLSRAEPLKKFLAAMDLIVVDVSFISLAKVLPETYHFLTDEGRILALVKPQFEVGRDHLDKRGVVKSEADVEQTVASLRNEAEKSGLSDIQVAPATIKGKDGNQEYFLYAKKDVGADHTARGPARARRVRRK